MTSWSALNVTYESWEQPDRPLKAFGETFEPADDVDVLFDWGSGSDRWFDAARMLAANYGHIEQMLEVEANDTSMTCTVREVGYGGHVSNQWSYTDGMGVPSEYVAGGAFESATLSDFKDLIEATAGIRPCLGGNWR